MRCPADIQRHAAGKQYRAQRRLAVRDRQMTADFMHGRHPLHDMIDSRRLKDFRNQPFRVLVFVDIAVKRVPLQLTRDTVRADCIAVCACLFDVVNKKYASQISVTIDLQPLSDRRIVSDSVRLDHDDIAGIGRHRLRQHVHLLDDVTADDLILAVFRHRAAVHRRQLVMHIRCIDVRHCDRNAGDIICRDIQLTKRTVNARCNRCTNVFGRLCRLCFSVGDLLIDRDDRQRVGNRHTKCHKISVTVKSCNLDLGITGGICCQTSIVRICFHQLRHRRISFVARHIPHAAPSFIVRK